MPNGDTDTETDDYGLSEDEIRRMASQSYFDTLMSMQEAERRVAFELPTATTPPPAPAAPVAPAPAPMTQTGTVMPPPTPLRGGGRMYMGPNIPQAQFEALPAGLTNLAGPAPVLAPNEQVALQRRIAFGTGGESEEAQLARMQAEDRPGFRTAGVMAEDRPEVLAAAEIAQNRYEGERRYRELINAGVPAPEAFARSGLQFYQRYPSRGAYGMTPYQQAMMASRFLEKPMTEYQRRSLEMREKGSPVTAYQQALIDKWKRPSPTSIEIAEHKELLKAIAKWEDELRAYGPTTERGKQIQQEINTLKARDNSIKSRYGIPVEAPPERKVEPRPLPTNKKDLVTGQTYTTSKGVFRWDGNKLVKVQ